MDTDPVIIEPPIEPPVPLPTPLVYNDTIDTTSMTNILLIDSIVYDKKVFYDSANANTFPIIYDSTSKTDDLISLLRQKFTTSSIERISLVFHDRGPNVQAPFMNNKIFFEESDLELNQTSFSENVSFLISCIKEFHVSHIDYLACNTLQHSNWKSYYALLASQTSVVVGASNNATGNMQYGGDWVMESTSEDVMRIYFNANISKYVSLLASTFSQNGGYLYLRMDVNNLFVQASTNGTTWASYSAAAWPITIVNSSPSAGNILRVVLTTDIAIVRNSTGYYNGYFIVGSTYITFDGQGKYVRVSGYSGGPTPGSGDYPGFIQGQSVLNISIQNFIIDAIDGSILATNAGWLCQRYFGRLSASDTNITNCINYANITNSNSGGIVGSESGNLNITNCINYSRVSGQYAGGIVGSYSKVLNITNCSSTGFITGTGSGGIAGYAFGYNSTNTYTISGCYSTGDILGSVSGGIVGVNVGNTSGSGIPVVNITNSYSLGVIGVSAGGICGGGTGVAPANKPTIDISNCYSFGSLFGAGQGLVAISLTAVYVNLTTSNTYIANGNWIDASANVSLTGAPTNISTNNPGASWTSVSSNPPYISSLSNAQLYNPSSVSTTSSYRTSLGLFQPEFTYRIFKSSQTTNVLTTFVFASKGTSPYYNSYNSNIFALTNTNPNGSTTTMTSSINSLNGILDIIVPGPTGPLTITANGSRQSVYLRMNGTQIEYGASPTGPWNLIGTTNWPVTIVNSNPGSSSILKVIVTQDLTISNTYGNTNGYFIIGTQYITFDGSGNHININNINANYPGFIQNSVSNIVVQNFIIDANIVSVLDASGGWLCQANFGISSTGNFIKNCTNNGIINGTIPTGANYTGGIAGRNAGMSGTLTFENCTNNGNILGWYSGGIAGSYAGASGTLTFINCTNTGSIIGNNLDVYVGPGGIVGDSAGKGPSSLTFQNCTNYGLITTSDGGGIAGSNCASSGGTATFTDCVNNGNLNGDSLGSERSGGIVGAKVSKDAGICTITNCSNNGYIATAGSGGIVGGNACDGNGNITLSNCFNTGDINTQSAGGIVGRAFGYNTNLTQSISACYSTGSIIGLYCGGIAGADIGLSTSAHIVNISNCYSLGDIGSTCGGIIGPELTFNIISQSININITNCYSFGALIGTGQGIVAARVNPILVNTSNCYIANGSWSDVDANANLTGTPTNITNNPGLTWTTLQTNTPYLLSAYNAQLYNPNSVNTGSSYRTTPGLFQPGFTYMIFKQNYESLQVYITYVFTYKGTSPYYYSYNYNSFTLIKTTAANPGAGSISSSINSLNGILDIFVPSPPGPTTITANGSTQTIYLRMNGSQIEYGLSLTGPWNIIYSYNWPVTIVNSNPGSSSILNVIFIDNLTISNTYGNTSGYFTLATAYITFDGANYNLNINSISNYTGFINANANLSNMIVTNIRTNVNNSTLSTNSGWICRVNFGYLGINNIISNCANNGIINAIYGGGIVGSNAGYGGILSITNCTNSGAITGQYAGGIAGQGLGRSVYNASLILGDVTLYVTGCTNTGAVSGFAAGGIAGPYAGNGKYSTGGGGGFFPQPLVVTNRAVSVFSNCTNTGNITADYGGGIVGQYAGIDNTASIYYPDNNVPPYGLTFINCKNTGSINSVGSGGIAGSNAGNATVYFENCTNTGNILVNAVGGGGIAGASVYRCLFYNCANSGDIIAIDSGGIAGRVTFTDLVSPSSLCSNTGAIIGNNAGGIVGSYAVIKLYKCYSTGIISGEYAGGIVGAFFYNSYNLFSYANIDNCYSTGNITGKEAGGIVGADISYGNSDTIFIANSYSLGTISGIQAGGIVGGSTGLPWTVTPYIQITNCYSYGTISNSSGGIVSPSYVWYPGRVNISNSYIANGNWSDAVANAILTGDPTSLTINNPGTTWTTLSTAFIPRVPYVLSSFNAQLYNPTSASSASNYSTTPGLIQPNFNYSILYPDQSGNVISPRVFASKGTLPYYYAYNSNTFTFTNTSSTSGTIYVAIAPSTGVLNFTLPVINQPIVTQIPNPFTPYAASPNNLGQVIYTDASYAVVPNIATNPTYILSTNVTDNTFDVFQNSAIIPAAFIPNSLFISNNLTSPSAIVKDSTGKFYVGSSAYNVISVYDNNGLYLRKISLYSAINIPLNSINYIAIDSSNNLYITSETNSGVYVVPAGSNENNLTSTILKYLYGNDFRGIACNANYLYIVVKRSSPAYIVKYNLTDKKYLQLNLSGTITSGEPLAIMYNNINISFPPLYITTIDGSNNSIYTISNITGPETLIGGIGSATITFLTTFPNNLYPYSLTMDNSANLYVGLDEGRITPVNVRSVGKIARVTSSGSISNISYLTYDGLGIGRPEGLLFEGSLYLYVTDILHNRVIKSRPKTFVFGPSVLNADAFYVKDPLNPTQYKTYLYDITNSIISTTFNLTADCFQKGTKILCENDIYVPIENIKVGDLVKTYKHGYQKVMRCVTRRSCDYISNSRNQIYTYTQKSNPELIEDLYLTGGHSLLVDALSETESNDMKQAEWLDTEFMVEDKYKLMCCFNKKLEVSANQNVELYRIALEAPENASPTHVYGIWANGILSESSSKASMDK